MTHSERRLLVAAKTDTGRVRDHNEDAYLVVDLDTAKCSESTVEFSVGDRGVLLAVSDGMGGAAAGEVASAVSCDALLTELSRDCLLYTSRSGGRCPIRVRSSRV